VDVAYGEGEEVYWIRGGGGKLGLDTERACWGLIWDWEAEERKCCGGLNAGKGRWKWVFNLEVEPEAEVEELDQGV
jgi:hypothetical protein